jgi:hypothetical protein
MDSTLSLAEQCFAQPTNPLFALSRNRTILEHWFAVLFWNDVSIHHESLFAIFPNHYPCSTNHAK